MTLPRSAVGPAHIFFGAGIPSSEEAPVQPAPAQVEVASAEVSAPAGWSPSMKKAELLSIALSKNLPVSSSSTKAEIVSSLEASASEV